ncbi:MULTISPECIES: YgaP family membrane protein [Halomicrobium]|uniref:Inner membrane protein YgaP-like transmembrane domain-containing protein n=2 Tax=Halomicrobium mukohataei TaxID=57705 RepID=C7P3I3_HALMD|nr:MULTISPECIES: DUF2892 domain-containing protein [Halomicrobium]ACV47655.1 conserved hypothetical protein [Halomicrobium mukohataei DSM 12286]QCD66110.1 DUF2892 domain-containing protein [Halomicrobium mukohataei]QFR20915.1 DUF2892 domain-containing protein [Halomicrobium sp. ZPS1]
MDSTDNVGGRDRIARALLAVVLSVAALRSLRNGKRLRGLLAGIGALAFGFNATTKYCGLNDALGIDTTGDEVTVDIDELRGEDTETVVEDASDDGGLTCADCGEPIVPGERRGPDEGGEIVHDRCH